MMDAVPARWADLLTPEHAISTTTLCLGVSLFAFNGFLVSTSLPTAVEELGGAALISWSLTVYLVLAIVGGSGAAFLKQRFGGRKALMGAALIFLAGSLLAALAPTMSQVLVGRALQGIGEGVVAAICYALIPELFPSRLVSKVFGAEAMVWATAAFGGPLAAGALTETISWRAAFLVDVPLSLIFIALVATVVPETASRAPSSGVPGLRLLAIGAGILLICWAGIVPEPALAIAMVAAAIGLLAAAIRLDRLAPVRLLPERAFSPKTLIGAGLWVILLMPMAQASSAVFLALTLQRLWHFSPTAAGAINALMAISWSLSAIAVANVQAVARRSGLIGLGAGLLVLGLAGVLFGLEIRNLALLIPGQAVIGVAFGVSWGPLSQLLMEAAPRAQRDQDLGLPADPAVGRLCDRRGRARPCRERFGPAGIGRRRQPSPGHARGLHPRHRPGDRCLPGSAAPSGFGAAADQVRSARVRRTAPPCPARPRRSRPPT